MANPILVAAAIAVPVLVVGVGGGYWYYKADRVVDSGTAGPYSWRVQRIDMKYIAEVKSPPRVGFGEEDFKPVPAPPGSLLPVEQWDTADAAKAKALEYIALASTAQPAAVSVQQDTADVETVAATAEMSAPVELTIAAVSPGVAFAGGL